MKLGLGTAQLGMNYGVANVLGKPAIDQSIEILKTAFEGGVRCFDTASSYGNSEFVIGEFIKGLSVIDLKEIQISTKFMKLDTAEQEVRKSLENLNCLEVDYAMLHNAKEVFIDPERFKNTINTIKRCGLAKKIGVSVYSVADILECLKFDIDVIQVPYNIIDHRISKDLFKTIKNRNIEVHARSIYLQGLLTLNVHEIPKHLEKSIPIINKLHELTRKTNFDLKELLFLFVRDSDCIDKFFIGCESTEQVKENLLKNQLPKLKEEIFKLAEYEFKNVDETILNPSLWNKEG